MSLTLNLEPHVEDWLQRQADRLCCTQQDIARELLASAEFLTSDPSTAPHTRLLWVHVDERINRARKAPAGVG